MRALLDSLGGKIRLVITASMVMMAQIPSAQGQEVNSITLPLIGHIDAPSPEWSTGALAHPLHNTGAGGPSFALIWGKSDGADGENSLCVFYDSNMKSLGEFHTSTSYPAPFTGTFDYEKIMKVVSGDIDGDGVEEIALIAQGAKDRGIYLLRWGGDAGDWTPIWRYEGPPTTYQRGLWIGNFSPSSGNELAFGNNEGKLFVLSKSGSVLFSKDLGVLSGSVGGNTIQSIRAADINKDGIDEMYIATGYNPGKVWKFEYEADALQLRWHNSVTDAAGAGNNCHEIEVHPNGHPDGGWGIGGGTEQKTDGIKGSMFVMDAAGNIKWQMINPSDMPRGGGADYKDVTGDGQPELISRGVGGPLGDAILIRDRRGELLCKQYVGMDPSTMGPYFVDYKNDGEWDVLNPPEILKVKVSSPGKDKAAIEATAP
jgi:hypothetical protein